MAEEETCGEADLEQQFGDEFRTYKASVRRWI